MSEERMDYALSRREKLIQYVRDVGQELIDKAEVIVGDPMLMSDIDICINIDCVDKRVPEIKVTTSKCPETTYNRLMKEL